MKIIFLILANDDKHYLQMQELWRKYMNSHDNIKSYFIKYTSKSDNTDIFIENNTIFIKGEESIIPGCLDKTIKSIEFLLENEEFDYLVRTNMSSVWDLKKIYNLILKNKYTSAGMIGYLNKKTFISGAGMVLNKNICELLVRNKKELDYKIVDDVSIGILLNKLNVKITQLTRFEAYRFENNMIQIDNNKINDFFHFRCKSNISNENSIKLMKHIIKIIYNL